MSDEEQATAIGRLMMERSQAKRQQALLQYELAGLAEKLAAAAGHLRTLANPESLRTARQVLNILVQDESLARARETVGKLELLGEKIPDLDRKLTEAGVA